MEQSASTGVRLTSICLTRRTHCSILKAVRTRKPRSQHWPRLYSRVLRAERDWSQAQLAELLDVSRQTINALETGKYYPSLPLAFKIAVLFQCKIEDIFQPENKDPVH